MRIAIEGPQLAEVNFHQILDIIQTTKSQNTIIIITTEYHKVVNIINLFHEILGGGGIPGRPYLYMKP